VMSASAAVNVLHRRVLAAAPPEEREAVRAKLIEEHIRVAGGVTRAVEIGVVDEVVPPVLTRRRIAEALAGTPASRGTHGNIPL
jgi:acetyl-CoA/propionyl-CoA carboxylase carboxyl transferase subunit